MTGRPVATSVRNPPKQPAPRAPARGAVLVSRGQPAYHLGRALLLDGDAHQLVLRVAHLPVPAVALLDDAEGGGRVITSTNQPANYSLDKAPAKNFLAPALDSIHTSYGS
jgi:hypothetical protein